MLNLIRLLTLPKSVGHLRFTDGFEIYAFGGTFYRVPITNPIVGGRRRP